MAPARGSPGPQRRKGCLVAWSDVKSTAAGFLYSEQALLKGVESPGPSVLTASLSSDSLHSPQLPVGSAFVMKTTHLMFFSAGCLTAMSRDPSPHCHPLPWGPSAGLGGGKPGAAGRRTGSPRGLAALAAFLLSPPVLRGGMPGHVG